jgi:hypothetical protein
MSRTAALSTIFLTVKRLIALSLATAREQFEQRTKLTWPRPFLLRPPFLLFLVCRETVCQSSGPSWRRAMHPAQIHGCIVSQSRATRAERVDVHILKPFQIPAEGHSPS